MFKKIEDIVRFCAPFFMLNAITPKGKAFAEYMYNLFTKIYTYFTHTDEEIQNSIYYRYLDLIVGSHPDDPVLVEFLYKYGSRLHYSQAPQTVVDMFNEAYTIQAIPLQAKLIQSGYNFCNLEIVGDINTYPVDTNSGYYYWMYILLMRFLDRTRVMLYTLENQSLTILGDSIGSDSYNIITPITEWKTPLQTWNIVYVQDVLNLRIIYKENNIDTNVTFRGDSV